MPPLPKRERDGHKKATIALGILTLGVLAFNAYLVVQAHELARNDQRAWVGPVERGVPVIEVGGMPSIAVIVTNHGRTPAVSVQMKTTYAVFAEGLHREPEYTITAPKGQSHSILFAGERLKFHATYDVPLTAEEVRDIEQETRALHLFVEITYGDFFGEPRRTAFAELLVRSPSDPSKWEWRSLGYYNEVE